MQFEINKLIEDFENEMWLYLEKSLHPERMNFWDEKLSNNPELKKMLDDTQKVLSLYNECAEHDISETSYKEIISAVTQRQNNFLEHILEASVNTFKKIFTDYRFAFGAAVIVTVIILTSVTEKPGESIIQKNVPLDWTGKEITSKIDKVDNTIAVLKTQNTFDYMMYRYTKDKVDEAILSIANQVQKLKDDMNEKTL